MTNREGSLYVFEGYFVGNDQQGRIIVCLWVLTFQTMTNSEGSLYVYKGYFVGND